MTGQADLEIGDTLTEESDIAYDAIPRFAPECFVYLHHTDTQTYKRFNKGLQQLLQEKVIQRFYPLHADQRIPLIGAVGQLQFDVVRYRLEAEYGAESRMEKAPWTITRWIDPASVDHPALNGYLSGATRVKDDARPPLPPLRIAVESRLLHPRTRRHPAPPNATGSNPRQRGVMENWRGSLERWSGGVLGRIGLMAPTDSQFRYDSSPPTLHHSSSPPLQPPTKALLPGRNLQPGNSFEFVHIARQNGTPERKPMPGQ